MLTKTDYTNLRKDFSRIFVTKTEFYKTTDELIGLIHAFRNELKGDIADVRTELKTDIENVRKELKNDILQFKDDILHEIVAMREELTVTLGHRDMLEDHETRITKLEKKRTSKSN